MNTAHVTKGFENYQICGKDGDEGTAGLPRDRWPWRRCGIYRSDVSIVVHIEPVVSDWQPATRDRAKEALYRYLRGARQTHLEYGIAAPLACVLRLDASSPLRRDLEEWSSDQDWHRGEFVLYVEDTAEEVDERLTDLLSPTVKPLTADRKDPKAIETYIAQLRQAAGSADDATRELVERCVRRWSDTGSQAEKGADPLVEWENEIVDQARRLATGGGI